MFPGMLLSLHSAQCFFVPFLVDQKTGERVEPAAKSSVLLISFPLAKLIKFLN